MAMAEGRGWHRPASSERSSYIAGALEGPEPLQAVVPASGDAPALETRAGRGPEPRGVGGLQDPAPRGNASSLGAPRKEPPSDAPISAGGIKGKSCRDPTAPREFLL